MFFVHSQDGMQVVGDKRFVVTGDDRFNLAYV